MFPSVFVFSHFWLLSAFLTPPPSLSPSPSSPLPYTHTSCFPYSFSISLSFLSQVRMFMGKMRELLLTDYKTDLLSEGMDSCQNFEHLLESTLQQCIILPLYSFLHTRLKDNLIHNGSFGQMKNAINNALTKTPEELGIRVSLFNYFHHKFFGQDDVVMCCDL